MEVMGIWIVFKAMRPIKLPRLSEDREEIQGKGLSPVAFY